MDVPVITPIAGKILDINVKIGERVEENDVLILVESMMLEIPVFSPTSGFIKNINVSIGQSVNPEDVIILIEEDNPLNGDYPSYLSFIG
jgi:biotin carboxyl carrier protein